MTWNEFKASQEQKRDSVFGVVYEETDITCPKCGNTILKRVDTCLTVYPVKHYYICSDLNKCDWKGIA